MSKRKTKKNKTIISIVAGVILLLLIIFGANTETLNQFSKVARLKCCISR